MTNSIYFTAEHQRMLRELVDNNLLVQLLNDASDGEVQLDTELLDASGVSLIAVFEQNDLPTQDTGMKTLF